MELKSNFPKMNIIPVKIIAACVLAVLVAQNAYCFLGDDEKQIEKEFGNSVGQRSEPEYIVKEYHFPPYNITVYFWNGKSAREEYVPIDGAALSVNEIASLLAANSDKQKWDSGDAGNYGLHSWSRADGNAGASYDFKTHDFDVTNPAFSPVLRRTPM